jgi:hypothetical protein
MRLEGRSRAGCEHSSEKRVASNTITRAARKMCDTLHSPARLVPRLRVTSPQPPSFRQRIATAQERDECLSGSLPTNLPIFAATLGFMELSMHSVGTGEPDHAVTLLAVEDEELASQSPARLLITAATQRGVETLARRVHDAGPRAQFSFVQRCAGDLPLEPDVFKEYCASVLAAAAGGSMLISAVEEMPSPVQHALIDLLTELEFARSPFPELRLIAGTTVSLLDRVAAGTFSARLFYRLNIIHLMADDSVPDVAVI